MGYKITRRRAVAENISDPEQKRDRQKGKERPPPNLLEKECKKEKRQAASERRITVTETSPRQVL